MGDLRRDVSLYTITPVQRCGLKSERNGRLVGRGAPTNRQRVADCSFCAWKENFQGERKCPRNEAVYGHMEVDNYHSADTKN
jgi:hypothetical protein